MNRKRLLLAGLLVVLALCLAYAYLMTPRLEKAPPRVAGSRVTPAAAGDGGQSGQVSTRIHFAGLEADPVTFAGAERDIFRFKQRFREPQPIQASPPAVSTVTTTGSPDDISFATIQAELSRFTFLGFMDKAGEKTVFLASGGTMFLAKRDDVFGLDREFTVAAIDGDLLKVRRSGHEGLIEIPLIERQKLAASVSAPARLAPLGGPAGGASPRTFAPRPKAVRSAEGAGAESYEPVVPEENSPTEQQEPEPPAEGNVIEGEVNGKKQ